MGIFKCHILQGLELKRQTQITGIYQIPAKLIKSGGRTTGSKIHKPIRSVWNKGELPEEWKESFITPFYKTDKTDCSNYRGILLCQLHTKFYPTSCCQG